MNLITPTELARIIAEKTGEPFTRQAVHKSIDEGRIPFTLQGKKKMVDLDHPAVVGYMSDANRQREQVKKNDMRSELSAEKNPVSGKRSDLLVKKQAEFDGTSPYELKQRKEIAQTRIAELKADHYARKNLPTDFIEMCYIKHIERLHSIIERIASTALHDIGSQIIAAGEVKPEHIESFTALFLEAVHNNKLSVAREVKKYEPV